MTSCHKHRGTAGVVVGEAGRSQSWLDGQAQQQSTVCLLLRSTMQMYLNFLKVKAPYCQKKKKKKSHPLPTTTVLEVGMICNNDVWPRSPFSAGAEFHLPAKSADGLRTRTHVHGFICRTRLASNLCVNVRLYCMFAYLFSHPIYSNSTPFHLRGCVCWLGSFFFPFFQDLFCYFGGDQMARGTEAPLLSGCSCERRLSSLM